MKAFKNIINRKILVGVIVFFVVFFLLEIYLPKSFKENNIIYYDLEKGSGYKEVANDLEKNGIIKSSLSFKFYVLVSRNYSKLQAGNYEVSSSMSIADIVNKFSLGGIVRNKVVIIEGWDIKDLSEDLDENHIYSKESFILATKKDFSDTFIFLKDKPKNMSLEGYIFPDTYYVAENSFPEELLMISLENFDKKLTPELRQEISKQKKTIFQIITMASMIEKEVVSLEDKKVVSGILWKRIKEGIPLQVDATVNYVTGKHDEKAAINDTEIDSLYNTYKYYGLPKGPISNPGIESILASIYPEKSDYWYYLSADGTGNTIFSKTFEEHNAAIAKYFK